MVFSWVRFPPTPLRNIRICFFHSIDLGVNMSDDIVRLIKDRFPHGIELSSVDYDDGLTDEQTEWYFAGDMERLCDSIAEWEWDNRLGGAEWYTSEIVSHIRKDSPNFDPDWEWLEHVQYILMEMDESDVLGDLIRRTYTKTTLCKWLIDEDNAVWGLHSVDGLIKALGVPDTVENRAVADELIANAPTDLGMAFSAYEAAPVDLQGVPVERAAISTRWLPVCYGNPFTGAYHVGAFDMGASVDVPLSELTPENNFVQWGPTEVYGEFPYELECEKEFIEIDT